jgi:hypothetical protein
MPATVGNEPSVHCVATGLGEARLRGLLQHVNGVDQLRHRWSRSRDGCAPCAAVLVAHEAQHSAQGPDSATRVTPSSFTHAPVRLYAKSAHNSNKVRA